MPISVLDTAAALARANAMDRAYLAPLRPVIIGPKAGLHRFAVAAERATPGEYDPLADQTYDYPDKTADSIIDLNSVKLYVDDARLNYFNKYVGTNGSCQPSSTHPNRVRAANYVFKTGNGVDRSAAFYDRNVAIGDVAIVRGTDSGDPVVLTTTVTGFVGETTAAVTGTATDDAANKNTQSASSTIEQVDDTPINDVVATTGGTYESSDDGYITRTYTITVTQSSTGGDATTGLLRVRSADGLDDQDDVVPEAFGDPTSIGTKGLTVTFDLETSNSSAASLGIDEDDFVVGQQWTVVVSQAFTAPTATAAGTYTGTRDDTYIVTVTRGGLFASSTKPQITVTTTNGSDSSGPTDVTAASTAIDVGNYDVTIAFNQTRLAKGDQYYITVTAAAEGALKTLVLADDVAEAIRGTEVDLRLFAPRDGVEIPLTRTLPSEADNWSFDADGLTVEGGIYLTDSEFTDDGDLFGVALDSGTLYVEYREWLAADEPELIRVNLRDDVAGLLGTVDPDNPVAYAADVALKNTYTAVYGDNTTSASTTTDYVYVVPIGGDPADADLWTAALGVVAEDEQAYDLVLLTTDTTIQGLAKSHVDAQSADAEGFYRRLFIPAVVDETAMIVGEGNSSDDAVVTATIAATTGTSPTRYTTLTASSNAQFTTAGVRTGDKIRISFGTDSTGEETYDEYTVSSVVSQTTLRLVTGPDAAISVARRVEVWRTYTKDELVTQLTNKAAVYASNRVHYVWPDRAGLGGETLAGYYVCAAVAGLAGSLPSHQGMRHVELQGFDDVARSGRFFTATQQRDLADGGVFVVSQLPDGTVYVRFAVTTAPDELATREEMLIRNADMLRKGCQSSWAQYVGAGNKVSDLQPLLDAALQRFVFKLKAGPYAPGLGAPVIGMNLTSIATVEGAADEVQVTVATTGTAVPLNGIRINLPVTVE